ncbi:MAG: putative DNA-binding domain-containing protein [Ignavibacteriaceae bacterium]
MLLRKETYQQQSNLSHYCRTGEQLPLIGVNEKRINYYPRLVFNVIDDTLRSAFPLTLDLLSKEEWETITRRFFASHRCNSYAVWKMPYEFYQYVISEEKELNNKFPFLEDLLLFEWTEIEIHMMEDKIFPNVFSSGDFQNDIIALNPEHKILQMKYPVHLKNPNEITDADEGEFYVLIFRQPETGKVQFIDISFFFFWLIQKILFKQMSLTVLLDEAEKTFGVEKSLLLLNTIPFLKELRQNNFILGFRNE